MLAPLTTSSSSNLCLSLTFQHAHPRYQTATILLVARCSCGIRSDRLSQYCCLHRGQGTHLVAMSCKSSLCLPCAKFSVDHWVSQVSRCSMMCHLSAHHPDRPRLSLSRSISMLPRCSMLHAAWRPCSYDFFSALSGRRSRSLHHRHPHAWSQWSVPPASASHRHQWRMGCGGASGRIYVFSLIRCCTTSGSAIRWTRCARP